eukprot:Partr_v1_DN25290_c0_g1_i2_m17011 putative ste20-related kinase adaptor
MDTTGQVRLCGLHQMISAIEHGLWKRDIFQFAGDPEWMAPEVISQATTFNNRVDIYAIGITALELLHGQTPFDGWPPLKILLAKLHYDLPDMKQDIAPSKAFCRFVERCVAKNPMMRPSARALLDDPFIKTAKNSHYLEMHLMRGMTRQSDQAAFMKQTAATNDQTTTTSTRSTEVEERETAVV